MSMTRTASALAAVAVATLLAACASGRTVITLPAPAAAAPSARATADRAVTITTVTDRRAFQDAPSEPSIPSLDAAAGVGQGIKARAVARKRNGYGMAQGDVVLAEPLTVSDVVKASVGSAFAEAGYRVAQQDAALPVQLRVDQFWLWLQPGVMVGTIRSRISVEVSMPGKPPFVITAETSQPGQIRSEEAWSNAVAIATAAFQKEAAARIAAELR